MAKYKGPKYKTIKCNSCGATPNQTTLIVIGDKMYCNHCLRNMKIKETGERVKYCTNVSERCFVFTGRGIMEEFEIDELKIGRAK